MGLPADMLSSVKEKVQPVRVVEVDDVEGRTRRSRATYAPFVTRSPFLIFVLVIVLVCIAVLQVAIRKGVDITDPSIATPTKIKRQSPQTTVIDGATVTFISLGSGKTTSSPVVIPDDKEGSATTTPSIITSNGPTTTPRDTCLTNREFPIPASPATTRSNNEATDTCADEETSSVTTSPPQPITTTTPPVNDDTRSTETSSKPPIVSQPPPINYITITSQTSPTAPRPVTTTTPDNVTFSPNPIDQLTVTSVTSTPMPGEPNPNDQLSLTSSSSNNIVTVTSGATPTDTNGKPLATLISSNGQLVTPVTDGVFTPTTVLSDGTPIATVSQASTATLFSSGVPIATVLQPEPSTVFSNGVVVATVTPAPLSTSERASVITYIASTTNSDGSISSFVVIGAAPTSTGNRSNGGSSDNRNKVESILQSLRNGPFLQLPIHFGLQHYFYAMYMSTLIAVILKTFWAAVYGANKMMEPFYQLNRPDGASARESLMSDYLSSGMSWWSVKVVFGGHWVMIFTLVVAILISILPPLATECMFVRPLAVCKTPLGDDQPCNPAWILNVDMIRVMQAILALIAACILGIICINFRRKSGINANPSSIATMATLLNHPQILSDVRSIHPNHSREEIEAILGHNRYQISSYFDAEGREHVGLTKANVSFEPNVPEGPETPNAEQQSNYPQGQHYTQVHNPALPPPPATDHNSHIERRVRAQITLSVILAVFVIGLLSVVLKYWTTKHDTVTDAGFNNFFNSNKFGPRFILTSAASIVAMIWLDIEREVRIHTPYRVLSKRNAKPEHTILTSVDGSPHQSLIGSLMRGNYFHFFVALVTVSSDILTVAISGVAFSSAQIQPAYRASTWISVGVLVLMVLVISGIFVWRWSNHKLDLPNTPNETLLQVWMGLANDGNVIRKCMEGGGWSQASKKERDEHLVAQNDRYWAGWTTEANGTRRWCVDGEGGNSGLPEYDEGTHGYTGKDISHDD